MSVPLNIPVHLKGIPLTDRESVADALYRAVLAFDLDDENLLRSALTDDVECITPRGNCAGISELKALVFDRVSKLDTTHFLNNIRISVEEGANTAEVTCTALAQHCPAGWGIEPTSPKYMSGGIYHCDMVRVDDAEGGEGRGLWKIKTWRMKFSWLNGDENVMKGE